MAVQIFQLLQVETRRRSADAVQIKQFDRPITRNDFLVTIAPAEPQQIIGDSYRQHSHIIAIGIHAQGSVPLGKLGRVRSMDKWHMGVDRKSVVEGKSVSVRVKFGGRSMIKKQNKENK